MVNFLRQPFLKSWRSWELYIPVEVVDFIIHSVNDISEKEFGRSHSDDNVHILEPFTGTGTFITRLLQSGLIKEKDLELK